MLAFRGSTFLHSLSTMEVFAHHLSSYMYIYIYIISIILYIYIFFFMYIYLCTHHRVKWKCLEAKSLTKNIFDVRVP